MPDFTFETLPTLWVAELLRHADEPLLNEDRRTLSWSQDITTLMCFLTGQHPDEMWGGTRCGDAFVAACRVLGYPRNHMIEAMFDDLKARLTRAS